MDEPNLRLPRREPAARRGVGRPLLIAGGFALALGVGAGLYLSSDIGRPEAERETRSPARTAQAPTPTPVAYQPPSAEQVGRALQRVRADYTAGGASAVAQSARGCFERLEAAPTYNDLDFCLAYDQFGEAMMRRLGAGEPPSADSWFGQTDARGRQAARAVLRGQGDPDARVLDVRRLSATASRDPAPSVQVAQAPEPAEPVEVAEAEQLQIVPVEPDDAPAPTVAPPPPAPPRPAPAPIAAPRQRAETPRRVQERQTAAAPARELAAEAPPVVEDQPRRRAERRERPPVVRVNRGARPSFNCRYARSTAERMVCSDPVLADADWRLHHTFERAMDAAREPRRLRAEQDRWLAEREDAAPDPGAVLDVYEERIAELADRF